jgi:hypothetical protein
MPAPLNQQCLLTVGTCHYLTQLSNEVDDNQMQNDMRKQEVCKCSFWSSAQKFQLVLWIYLNSQAN